MVVRQAEQCVMPFLWLRIDERKQKSDPPPWLFPVQEDGRRTVEITSSGTLVGVDQKWDIHPQTAHDITTQLWPAFGQLPEPKSTRLGGGVFLPPLPSKWTANARSACFVRVRTDALNNKGVRTMARLWPCAHLVCKTCAKRLAGKCPFCCRACDVVVEDRTGATLKAMPPHTRHAR